MIPHGGINLLFSQLLPDHTEYQFGQNFIRNFSLFDTKSQTCNNDRSQLLGVCSYKAFKALRLACRIG